MDALLVYIAEHSCVAEFRVTKQLSRNRSGGAELTSNPDGCGNAGAFQYAMARK
jgi:hypothetical protein